MIPAPVRLRLPVLLGAAGLAALAAAVPAAAQQTLTLGQTVRGSLSASDPTLDDGSHYDVYRFTGPAGQRVRVTLRSEAFDAFLSVGRSVAGECEDCEMDDDSGGGTDARVDLVLEGGTYEIRANSLGGGETGDYTLSVTASEPVDVTPRGEVRVGQTVRGSLDEGDPLAEDDSYFEVWTFRGPRGQRITVTLRSEDFDTFLAWGRMADGEWQTLDADDDGLGDGSTDSQLQVTLGDDGRYLIRANSLSAGETGDYTLTVEEGGRERGGSGGREWDEGLEAVEPRFPSSTTPIRAGQTLEGALAPGDGLLEDGSLYDLYTFQGRAGQRVRITLRSEDFDAFLALGTGLREAFELQDSDDDGAGGTDSQLEVTLPRAGTYVIRANSLSAGETGRYTITVQAL